MAGGVGENVEDLAGDEERLFLRGEEGGDFGVRNNKKLLVWFFTTCSNLQAIVLPASAHVTPTIYSLMNTFILRSSLHALFTAMLMASMAARAVDVKVVGDTEVQNALKATVLINTFTGPETGHATLGFFATSDGLVITAAVSMEGAQKFSVRLADGTIITDAKFLGLDGNKCLAVLATNRKPAAFLKLSDSTPAVGDACAVLGMHPTERSLWAASGQVLAQHPSLNQAESQFLDMLSIGARRDCLLTGGTVVNARGEVVGLCDKFETRQGKQWITQAIPVADIRARLEKNRQTKQTESFPRLGEINRALASPAQSDTDYLEGVQLMKQGDYSAAIQRFANTLSRHPKDSQTLTFLASCYSQTRQAEEVAKCAKELASAGVKLWSNRIGVAGMLANAGNPSAARECLQSVLNEEPRLGNAWTLHATILQRMGRKKEALEAARRGAELEPESLWSWSTLSDLLLELGDIKAYQQARERADDLESLLFKLDHLPLRGLQRN